MRTAFSADDAKIIFRLYIPFLKARHKLKSASCYGKRFLLFLTVPTLYEEQESIINCDLLVMGLFYGTINNFYLECYSNFYL